MELSSKDIIGQHFKSAMRGYSKSEVRSFLDDVEHAMRALEEHLAIEGTRAAHAEEDLTEMRTRIDDLVEEASTARHKIIEQAKRDAVEIAERTAAGVDGSTIADAAECAAGIIARAEADVARRLAEIEQLCVSARDEAERTLTAAQEDAATTRAEAARVLDEARRQARSTRAQAESERATIVEEISRLKQIASTANVGDIEDLESANVILRSGTEITIDLREEAPDPDPRVQAQ